MHRLTTIQTLPISLDEAWEFFSNPSNLSKITPKEMNLIPTSVLPEKSYPGMFITYHVKPLLGIPMLWVTEITHLREREFFVDEQRLGPYRIWHHQHHFKAVKG
ncbi:MAG: SRPBCC family protein, partial [Saprospiraceae bacterium]|nr:SRPBCC family protein [Saprospiraceae bacterium]